MRHGWSEEEAGVCPATSQKPIVDRQCD